MSARLLRFASLEENYHIPQRQNSSPVAPPFFLNLHTSLSHRDPRSTARQLSPQFATKQKLALSYAPPNNLFRSARTTAAGPIFPASPLSKLSARALQKKQLRDDIRGPLLLSHKHCSQPISPKLRRNLIPPSARGSQNYNL